MSAAFIYVAVMTYEYTDSSYGQVVLTIAKSKKRAVDAIIKDRNSPIMSGTQMFAVVVKTEMDAEYEDGLINEHPVYEVKYTSEGTIVERDEDE